MKNITILIAAFALTAFGFNTANAQAGDYSLTSSSGTFTSIVGTGETNQPLVQADSYITPSTPIGFTFNFEGVAYTNFKASSNGVLSFGAGTNSLTTNNLDFANIASRPLVAPLWDDNDGRATGGSTASYIVTGTAPNRVLTYEWLNWQWKYGSSDPVISFQVKLYETTDVIEFVYQQESGAISYGTASIGLTGLSSFLSLDNTGTSPSASNTSETDNLDTKPASGQTYTFTPPTCSTTSALTASNITTTAADLGWISTTGTWDIEWGVDGFPATGTPNIKGKTNNPYNLTGLTSNTSYEFYVRADCGGTDGASNWTGPFSFTTPCNALAIPFSENFSSTSTTQNCWTVIDNNTDGDMWNMDYALSSLAGDQVAIISTDYNNGANDDYLITPTLTLTGNEQLRFSYRVRSASEPNEFEVLLSTTGKTPADFTNTLMALDTFSNTTYTETTIDLSAYSGNVNIAFHVPAGGLDGWIIYIDSVEVEIIPTCLRPTALTVANVTATTADLEWTSTAGTWDIEWGIDGFSQGSGTMVTGSSTNPQTLTGLAPLTAYKFYVRADCGTIDGLSLWAGPYSFRTLCPPTFIPPFLEAFDASTSPDCWTQSAIDGGPWEIGKKGSGAELTASNFKEHTNNGGYYAWMDFSSNDDSVMFELPVVDISATVSGNYELNFFFASHNTNTSDSNFLYVQAWNGNVWSNIAAIQQDSSEWVQYNYDLTAFTYGANLTKIRFVADRDTSASTSAHGQNDLLIDDVRISEACVIPTAGIISDLTSSSISLGWTTTGSAATNWSIEYGPTGFVQGTGSVINGTNFNPHPIHGLIDATAYDFYIISNCALAEKSPWAGPFNVTTYVTGVDENSANNDVSIYPNPNNGIFTLTVKAKNVLVKVMNTQGQVIFSKNNVNTNEQIDLSNNAKGIYFVTVTSNEAVTTQKVIVR